MKNMNNWLRIPGFPPPEKQDSVQFHVCKALPYPVRMLLYFVLIILGFSIQLIMMTVWPGALLLIFATMLNLVRGYDSRARLKAFDVDSNWTEVDMDRIHEVQKLDDRITKWNQDGLDISNILGIATFLVTAVAIIFVSVFLGALTRHAAVASIFVMDAIILILPLWFNGIRRILKQDNLRVKTGIITNMEEHFNRIRQEGEHFKPALMLARNEAGKSIPTDARFTISFADMPVDFYGIQAQININVVQGASHPYFYCVLPARPGFGLEAFAGKMRGGNNIVVEFQQDAKAEVAVFRQFTTKESGYSTNPNTCRSILEITLEAARTILKERRHMQ